MLGFTPGKVAEPRLKSGLGGLQRQCVVLQLPHEALARGLCSESDSVWPWEPQGSTWGTGRI
jgi:hypothetical protein